MAYSRFNYSFSSRSLGAIVLFTVTHLVLITAACFPPRPRCPRLDCPLLAREAVVGQSLSLLGHCQAPCRPRATAAARSAPGWGRVESDGGREGC